MWLNIKLILIFFFLGISVATAQEMKDSTENGKEKYKRFLVYSGMNRNVSVGDGFIADDYKLNIGGELGLDFMITKNLLAGFQFDLFNATATNPDNLAGVQRTRITSSSLHFGYRFSLSKTFFLNLNAGFGHARYSNKASYGGKFHDDASFLYAQPKLVYNFTENWSVYLAAAMRRDNLKIDTSPDYEEYFDSSTRIPVSLGIQLGI